MQGIRGGGKWVEGARGKDESLTCSVRACQQDEQKLQNSGQPGSASHSGTTQHICPRTKPLFRA